ncbi:MAG: hypothetical protein J0L92_16775 [Deltaproteobacteria bacterium]|nr:hypothetical protein [Deltaproteobacteria bacterium]
MPRVLPMPLVVLALVAVAAGDVVIVAWSFGSWDHMAQLAIPRNRALAEDLRRHERARCWAVAPDDPSLEACDVAETFDAHLVELSHPDVPLSRLTAEADRALRCRCVSIDVDIGQLHRVRALTGTGTDAEHVAWRERQLLLMTTLATATELGVLAEAIDDAATTALASNEAETVSRMRGVIARVSSLVHDQHAKTRRLVMSVSRDAMSAALFEVGGSNLRGHDRAARALEVSRALDACTDPARCAALARSDVLDEVDRLSLREVLEVFDRRVHDADALLARSPRETSNEGHAR